MQDVRMNAGRFIDFLKALLGSVDGKIFLIVHGHPGSYLDKSPGVGGGRAAATDILPAAVLARA
jgi:hypothetical protein